MHASACIFFVEIKKEDGANARRLPSVYIYRIARCSLMTRSVFNSSSSGP